MPDAERTVARPPDVQQRIGLIRSTNVDVFKGLAEYPQVATGVDHARAQPRKLQRLDRAVDCEALGDAIQRVVTGSAIEQACSPFADFVGPRQHAPRPGIERGSMAGAQPRDIA